MTASILLASLFLLLAVGHDFRHRRIPNSLVAVGTLAAMACAGAPSGIGLQLALAGMAWQGYFTDTEGNVFGLHQPDPHAA